MSGAAIVAEARKYLGVPYVWAGESPSGFDCSGLVKYVYQRVTGRVLPHSTSELIRMGSAVSQSNLQLGDLVFPSEGHVGIFSGNGKFIHAPKTGDVVKEANIYAFHTARRLL